jgi:hypothetical protein
MSAPLESLATSIPKRVGRDDADLLRRIEGEFREMPGLRLTLSQAARLFSLDPLECERVLQALVRAGRLRLSDPGFALIRDSPLRSYLLN